MKYGEHETGRSTYGSRFLIFRPNGRENIPLNGRWRVGVGQICARVGESCWHSNTQSRFFEMDGLLAQLVATTEQMVQGLHLGERHRSTCPA